MQHPLALAYKVGQKMFSNIIIYAFLWELYWGAELTRDF